MAEIIDNFIPVAIFIVFGLVIHLAIILIVKQISPRSKNPIKFTTY
ncbi:MAG: NADH-quinone oxidoreductase subunit A, partial [Candidatus Methanocomedens sp.]